MLSIVLRRLIILPIVIAVVAAIMFILVDYMPGDPILLMLGETTASKQQIQKLRDKYNLDAPLYKRYFTYLRGFFLELDLGESLRTRQAVRQDIARYFPASVELILLAVLIAYPLGIILGSLAAAKKGCFVDSAVRFLAFGATSAPVFWIALLLQIIFFAQLGWLPAHGQFGARVTIPPRVTGFMILDTLIHCQWNACCDHLIHLILPTLTLALFQLAVSIRMTRAGMIEALQQPYIATARSKGLAEGIVIRKHALKNSLIPLITTWGTETATLAGGLVIIETIFAWPGFGSYILHSVLFHDYYAITSSVIILLIFVSVVNLIADLMYNLLNPQLRYE